MKEPISTKRIPVIKNPLTWLFIVLTVLTAIFLLDIIDMTDLITLSAIWFIGFFLLMVGPETISKISLGYASIERDVKAAKEIRDEIDKISDDLKKVVKMSAENSWILASSSALVMSEKMRGRKRLEKNLSLLTNFFEPNEREQDKFWEELRSDFDAKS